MVRMNAHGSVELIDKEKGKAFLVNGQRVKYYWVKIRINRGHRGNFMISDFELNHVGTLNQALHGRKPMLVM